MKQSSFLLCFDLQKRFESKKKTFFCSILFKNCEIPLSSKRQGHDVPYLCSGSKLGFLPLLLKEVRSKTTFPPPKKWHLLCAHDNNYFHSPFHWMKKILFSSVFGCNKYLRWKCALRVQGTSSPFLPNPCSRFAVFVETFGIFLCLHCHEREYFKPNFLSVEMRVTRVQGIHWILGTFLSIRLKILSIFPPSHTTTSFSCQY